MIVIFLKLHSFYKNYKDMYIFKLFYFVILNQELMPILTFCDFSRPGFNKILTHLNCSYMLNLLGLVKQLSHRKITLSLSVHFLYLDWIRRFTGMSQYRKTGDIVENYPAGNYLFKVNGRNIRTRYEICSKVTHCSSVSIVNFEHLIAGWV